MNSRDDRTYEFLTFLSSTFNVFAIGGLDHDFCTCEFNKPQSENMKNNVIPKSLNAKTDLECYTEIMSELCVD